MGCFIPPFYGLRGGTQQPISVLEQILGSLNLDVLPPCYGNVFYSPTATRSFVRDLGSVVRLRIANIKTAGVIIARSARQHKTAGNRCEHIPQHIPQHIVTFLSVTLSPVPSASIDRKISKAGLLSHCPQDPGSAFMM